MLGADLTSMFVQRFASCWALRVRVSKTWVNESWKLATPGSPA